MKHTEGPWNLSCKFGGATEIRDFITIVDSDNRLFVALASKQADAHLIAAAPEMLEALEQIKKSIGHNLADHTRKMVFDAINKAKGRAQ